MDLLKEEADAMIEPMLEVKTDFAAQIKEMEQLITRNTLLNTMESNSRAGFKQSMENLKNAVAEMVKQIPERTTTDAECTTPNADVEQEQGQLEPNTSPTKSRDGRSTRDGRIDGYIWPPRGAKALAEDEKERANLKDRDWIWTRRFYDETEAIQWLNKEEEFDVINEMESSKKEDDDDVHSKDNSASHKSKENADSNKSTKSDEPYKDHDPRSKNYNGTHDKRARKDDDFPHVEYGDYQPAWHGYHDGSCDGDIEHYLSEQYDRDAYGMDYYESMGDC
jgi:hypothetical protein